MFSVALCCIVLCGALRCQIVWCCIVLCGVVSCHVVLPLHLHCILLCFGVCVCVHVCECAPVCVHLSPAGGRLLQAAQRSSPDAFSLPQDGQRWARQNGEMCSGAAVRAGGGHPWQGLLTRHGGPLQVVQKKCVWSAQLSPLKGHFQGFHHKHQELAV